MGRILAVALAVFVMFVLAPAAFAGKRIALVIGNSAYKSAPRLANPVNDASDTAKALTELGYEVILGLDLDRRGLEEALRKFSRQLDAADTRIFFYAGHGMQLNQHNYLVPIDAVLNEERDVDFETIALNFILRQMEAGSTEKTNILFLDACRDNPFAKTLARSMGTRSAAVGKGLAQTDAGAGTFIAYATQPDNVAQDGDGRNSPFTAAFLKSLRQPQRTLPAIMIDVRNEVIAATSGKQVPWDHSALTAEFYFQPPEAANAAPSEEEKKALAERLRQIEDELKKAQDPQRTANIVLLAQLKERSRQIQADNKRAIQQIFDLQRKAGTGPNQLSRMEFNEQVGQIHMEITRRNQENNKLKQQIGELETALGLASSVKAAEE